MALQYYTATPNNQYRDLMQAFIDDQWDNTSALSPANGGALLEQWDIGSEDFCPIEAWIDTTVDDVTSGARDARDYLKLIFKDIYHRVPRGLQYKFDGNTWLATSSNPFGGLPKAVNIRRCNNALRIIDPLNGSVVSMPCIVEYDAGSPMNQVGRYVITPNNHLTVMVQGSEETWRLLKLNTRYVLGARVFKLNAYQNALNNADEGIPSLLYLDLYLDELHDGDNIDTQIADNGKFDYGISINSDDISVVAGAGAKLSATVTLNGEEVERDIEWSSNNISAITIDENGQYSSIGSVGDFAIITAQLSGNENVSATITVTIADIEKQSANIVINPLFEKIRQNDNISFNIAVEYAGVTRTDLEDVVVAIADADREFVAIDKIDDLKYLMVCKKIAKQPIEMTVSAKITGTDISAEKVFAVKTVGMFG